MRSAGDLLRICVPDLPPRGATVTGESESEKKENTYEYLRAKIRDFIDLIEPSQKQKGNETMTDEKSQYRAYVQR
jgi:hypothetical protein